MCPELYAKNTCCHNFSNLSTSKLIRDDCGIAVTTKTENYSKFLEFYIKMKIKAALLNDPHKPKQMLLKIRTTYL